MSLKVFGLPTGRLQRKRLGAIALVTVVCVTTIWCCICPSQRHLSDREIDHLLHLAETSHQPSPGHGTTAPTPSARSRSSLDSAQDPLLHDHPSSDQVTILDPLDIWGIDLSSADLSKGLRPWPVNSTFRRGGEGESPLLTKLGLAADEIYDLGPRTLSELSDHLERFIDVAMPEQLKREAKSSLEAYMTPTAHTLPTGKVGDAREAGKRVQAWNASKIVWQTDKGYDKVNTRAMQSWRTGYVPAEGWKWKFQTDAHLEGFMRVVMENTRLSALWDKADFIRYLFLYVHGGIYTDADTHLLQPPSQWGKGAVPWKGGRGWMSEVQIERVAKGEGMDEVLGPPSVVVGVEVDTTRGDWYRWWTRPVLIAQWTMASAPYHPITLSALLRILHKTSKAVDHVHAKCDTLRELHTQEASYDEMKGLFAHNILTSKNRGGPIGILDWTGPALWSDAVFGYLHAKYGVVWTDLRDLKKPLRIGDVVILPETGFHPGWRWWGSGNVKGDQAMVKHIFDGSWKKNKDWGHGGWVTRDNYAATLGATR